ncbi:TIR domain-containing protein [Pseudomonas sp. RIT288]|uniref:TIR domain-containing protein n=1 Tax=Pseudomonas sp. RIT288 TaxID=1470589 RepID=UPI0006917540|nr:TIR domain-containing protein [Pseudomonas sp. RIT288]
MEKMLDRLKGSSGQPEALRLLKRQELVQEDSERAGFLLSKGELIEFEPDTHLITYGEASSDVYFLLSGDVRILKGKHILNESFRAGNCVGEIAAIQVVLRTATVIANTSVVALKVAREDFVSFIDTFPAASKALAFDLAARLERRNDRIATPGRKHRIFVISSTEAMSIALTGIRFFSRHDEFEFCPWPIETFRASSYPLDDLEAELETADFAIAIAQGDDVTESRDSRKPSPRDNVLFELGLFMGRLGRKRTLLMTQEGCDLKLPSDLSGMMVVKYSKQISSTPSEQLQLWQHAKDHFGALI